MDEVSAVALLRSLGYGISGPKAIPPVFVCIAGHSHKTESARNECDRLTPKRVSRAEYAARMNAAARPRYEAAYLAFAEGKRKSEVAKIFGVSPSRADSMIKRGWRYALKNGLATRQP